MTRAASLPFYSDVPSRAGTPATEPKKKRKKASEEFGVGFVGRASFAHVGNCVVAASFVEKGQTLRLFSRMEVSSIVALPSAPVREFKVVRMSPEEGYHFEVEILKRA